MSRLTGGVYASLVTPFSTSDAINVDRLRALVRFSIEAGVSGILCTALAGEVNELTLEERQAVITCVLEEAGGSVPVVAGVGTGSERELRDIARFAEREGAEAVLLAPSRDGDGAHMIDQVLRLAAAIQLPVMLQDAPAYIGHELGPAAIEHIVGLAPNVRHLKVEGGPHAVHRARKAVDGLVSVWGGDGGMFLLDCLRVGAVGVMPGVEVVDRLVQIYLAERDGDSAESDRLMTEILPLIVFLMQSLPDYVAGSKAILVHRALLRDEHCRMRGAILDDGMRRILERHLRSVGLLSTETLSRSPFAAPSQS